MTFIPLIFVFITVAHFVFRFSRDEKTVSNFVLRESYPLPQYKATMYLYEHKKHGSPFLHIKTGDKHNFFATTFRTTCIDDSGSTHVLEHLSLHGSKKYPIRSVFTELIKNSVATFLNAFTSVEWTAYPFSSTNHKDFHNVMDVYMDAIFHPKLDEIDFKSEAYHLEFVSPENSSTPLRHSGVVYNEMNGDLSNPESRFEGLIRENLYPDSLFHFQYGGDPKAITKLTLQKIKEQHDRYYHPSNALFFHYGSFDEKEIMEKIDEIISPFDEKKITIPDELVDQPKWKAPHFAERDGPAGDNLSIARASVNWITGDMRNYTDVSDLSFLSSLLTYSQASPLYKGLIKAGVGTNFLNTGYYPYVRSPYFTIGLEGIELNKARKLNETVLKLLNEIYENGFEKSQIDSILHQYELTQKSVSASLGMDMWESIVNIWIHNVNPYDLLDSNREISRIKETLKRQPRYFELLMKEKLIDNTHRLDLVMKGVEGFEEKQSKEVQKELDEKKARMSEQEKEEIVQTAKEIREAVDAPKPLELLPKITVQDLNASYEPINPKIKDNIWYFEQPTNDVSYVNIKCELPLNKENIADMSLLDAVISSIGAGDLNEEEFASKTSLYTGGISTSLTISPSIDNADVLNASFVISSSALVDDFDKMLELMKKVLLSPWLNNTETIRIIMQSIDSNFISSITSDGHKYALLYSSSGLSKGSALNEMWNGVTCNKRIHKIVEENNWENVSKLLKAAYEKILLESTFSGSIHCNEEHESKLVQKLGLLVKELNEISQEKRNNDPSSSNAIVDFMNKQKDNKKVVLDIDSSTFFCSIAMNGPLYKAENSITRMVAQTLIKSEFLHNMIREKLGAYGVMEKSDLYTGTYGFVSYRDTNPKEVIDAFKQGVEIATTNITQEMVNRAILQIFSDLDQPQSPSSKGISMFLKGLTNEIIEKFRKNVLKVQARDVIEEAKKMKSCFNEWTSAIVGSSALISDFVNQNNYTSVKVI